MNRKKAWTATVIVGAVIGALNLAHYAVTLLMPSVERPFPIFPGGLPVAAVLGLTSRSLWPELVVMMVLIHVATACRA